MNLTKIEPEKTPKTLPAEVEAILVRGDGNIEDLPLVRTRSRHRRSKEPILIKRTDGEGRFIGTVELSNQISRGAYIFYEELILIFRESQCPKDGTIFDSLNAIMADLYAKRAPDPAHPRTTTPAKWRSGFGEKRWVKEKVDELMSTSVKYDNCYFRGKERLQEKVSFFLIERSVLYERSRKDKEFTLSMFRLPQYVADNIRNGKTKPIRLDVLMSFRSDLDVILYRYLDPMLYAHEHFEKDFDDFCKENALEFARQRHGVQKVKASCKTIIGKELSSPYIVSKCDVVPSGTPSGFKIVADRAPRPATIDVKETETTEKKQLTASEKQEKEQKKNQEAERRYYEFYQSLPQTEQNAIEAMVTFDFIRKIFGQFGKDTDFYRKQARYEAIKQYYEQSVTRSAVKTAQQKELKLMCAREPAADDYLPDPAVILRRMFRAMPLALEYKH